MIDIKKYPRTPHVEGSGIQRGDDDLTTVPFDALVGRHLVVTEKMDGANCAIRFTAEGELLLQSRGHYLAGGAREQQFHLFKAWAHRYAGDLLDVLEDRYIMYGEWLYAKHSVFYTCLPHYFLEFDIYDTVEEVFLSAKARRALRTAMPFVDSVRVLHEGTIPSLRTLIDFVQTSPFIGADVVERLKAACQERGLDADLALRQTDTSRLMEGLYIKAE
ncbi:MAG: RNA ligase family protein, partial [Thermomicrobiales bacterium]